MKKKILLVDDEPGVRQLLGEALLRKGYEVLSADSGAQAKRIFQGTSPDLLISDLQMEDTDGFSLIEELKKTRPGIPVLLLTGVIFDPETIAEAIEKNISSYINKTAPLQQILGEVQRLCPV